MPNWCPSNASTREPETKTQAKSTATTGRAVVQRRVGFEFESVEPKWRFQGRDDDEQHWAGIANTKKVLLPTASGKAGVSADNGNVEFKTEPLSTWTDVVATIGELRTLAANIQSAPGRIRSLTEQENAAAGVNSGNALHRIVGQSVLSTKPQATVGVSLLGIADLFRTLRGFAEGTPEERAVGNATATYKTEASASDAERWLRNAVDRHELLKGQPADITIHAMNEAHGFLTMVLKVLWDAYSNSGSQLTDPKYAFPIMPRTHFKAMLESMQTDSQATIRDLWTSGALAQTFEFNLDSLVFPGGYSAADKTRVPVESRTTKRQWLGSIFADGPDKDLLSPPVGYRGLPEEGLGAMERDPLNLRFILLELRHVTNGEAIGPDAWLPLARVVASIDAVREGQSALRPQ